MRLDQQEETLLKVVLSLKLDTADLETFDVEVDIS